MNKQNFEDNVLGPLKADNISALDVFSDFQKSDMDLYDKIEMCHEFIDTLCFKLRESKSTMDKSVLAVYCFDFFKKTIKTFDYNPKFIAAQCKSLVTYHKNQKDLSTAIEVLEFLIQNGIADDDGHGYHIQLDELYRLRLKKQQKGQL